MTIGEQGYGDEMVEKVWVVGCFYLVGRQRWCNQAIRFTIRPSSPIKWAMPLKLLKMDAAVIPD